MKQKKKEPWNFEGNMEEVRFCRWWMHHVWEIEKDWGMMGWSGYE